MRGLHLRQRQPLSPIHELGLHDRWRLRRIRPLSRSELFALSRESFVRASRFHSVGVSNRLAHARCARGASAGGRRADSRRGERRRQRGDSGRQVVRSARDCHGRNRRKIGQSARTWRRLRHQPSDAEDPRRGQPHHEQAWRGRGLRTCRHRHMGRKHRQPGSCRAAW